MLISLIIVIICFKDAYNQNSTTQVCYGSEDSDRYNIIFLTANGYIPPPELDVIIKCGIKSKWNNKYSHGSYMYRTLYKMRERCETSFKTRRSSSDDEYIIYEFTFMRNHRTFSIGFNSIRKYENFYHQILDQFIVEMFNPKNKISAFLKGIHGEITMKVEFESSQEMIYPRNVGQDFSEKSYSSKLTSYHTCLFLQHDKLWMSIPIQQLSDEDFERLYNTKKIGFIYTKLIDDVNKSVNFVYDSWVLPCQATGLLIFDFVIREKINQSYLEITFFGDDLLVLGKNKYNYSESKNKFVPFENSMINIYASVISLDEAILNPRSTHIYLGNFNIKTINCNYTRGIAVNHKVRQFDIERYHTHLLPSIETPIDGIIPWHPLSEEKFLELIANGTIKCQYDQQSKN